MCLNFRGLRTRVTPKHGKVALAGGGFATIEWHGCDATTATAATLRVAFRTIAVMPC